MKQFNYNISCVEGLSDVLQSDELATVYNSHAQLVQIFSAKNNNEWYQLLGNEIRNVFPTAVIVGASTAGEINEGKILTDSTVILFTFFESSSLNMFSYECTHGNEVTIGKSLVKDIESLNLDIKGMLLLAAPFGNDSSKLFKSITEYNLNYPVFGGLAGDYANTRNTKVFDGRRCFEKGVVAVVFSGSDLIIEAFTYLGWHPLSKEMTITEIDDMNVKTIDDNPAISVYEKYLGIKADDNFFLSVLEFPFLFTRNELTIARVPFFANEKDGSIQFAADIQVGEKFRIGYGDPKTITTESIYIHGKMLNFQPNAIFLYSCICRRFLLQHDVDLETAPLNRIAPVAGFYTFGEFFAYRNKNALFNSTMVAVGLREGSKRKKNEYDTLIKKENAKQESDPYENQHARIVSSLLYYINATIKELEEQNQLLKSLNEQKNEFLGIAAHDLRNPIGTIQGYTEMLEEHISDEYKEYTKVIINISDNMLHLLNELLDISKIEAGRLDLIKNEVDYIVFVRQNIKMNEFFSQKKRITIVGDFEMPNQTLFIDKGKIEQVLNNLIGNSIKYSYPDTEIAVKIFKENNQIVTQIIDQGQGIPSDETKGIFAAYNKTSIRPTGDETSHGLGLAIVKKIVEGHNGSVGLTSEVGKGSTFYFTIPL